MIRQLHAESGKSRRRFFAVCRRSRSHVPDQDNQVPIACFRGAGGALVAEADLTSDHRRNVGDLIDRARSLGVDKLWVYAHVIDAEFGFRCCGSHTRLAAERPPAPVELAFPPLECVREIQRACFAGVWGHQDPDATDPAALFVALREHGAWVGICEIDPASQWIDGPGVVPGLRTPDRYARLVRGASAHLRDEPVVLDTWGDPAATLAAYFALGFEVVHSVPGWELDLSVP